MMLPTTIFGWSTGAKPMNQPWSFPCGFCAVPVFPAALRSFPPLAGAVACCTTPASAHRRARRGAGGGPEGAPRHLPGAHQVRRTDGARAGERGVEPPHVHQRLGILALAD